MEELQPVQDLEKYVDVDDALARVCGNKNIYKMLLGKVEKSMIIDQLCDEVAAGDFAAAARTAHSIKGVAANLSLKAAYEKVLDVEQHLKQGMTEAGELDELREILATTLKCVKYVASTL